ncbi:hypothetical protein ILUMI_20624 [Ignelater luminosus]|uniref:Uncharacterized protein n=1 Tax=Ignelater luminosus TaxID=2038154 RepID=A0A8K0G4E2_IGNLU|nr:hypothetical protein ILUMI_20624 [Ignelater luminosus]
MFQISRAAPICSASRKQNKIVNSLHDSLLFLKLSDRFHYSKWQKKKYRRVFFPSLTQALKDLKETEERHDTKELPDLTAGGKCYDRYDTIEAARNLLNFKESSAVFSKTPVEIKKTYEDRGVQVNTYDDFTSYNIENFMDITAKCKNLKDDVQELQRQIECYVAIIKDCQKKITYIQENLTETFGELQNVMISVNKADVMDCSVSGKIKQIDEVLKEMNVPSSVLDVKLEHKSKTNKEDLLMKSQELKQAIFQNTAIMKDVLESFNLFDVESQLQLEFESSENVPATNKIDQEVANTKSILSRELRLWAIKGNISHTNLTKLLHILHTYHPELPLDSRTLLDTSFNIKHVSLETGGFVYFGIEYCLRNFLSKYNAFSGVLDITFNIDGLPLFNSRNVQLWPILGKVANFK